MKPNRGEVWLADLNPTRGHEQAGQRPVLVVSVDPFNHGPAGLVIVVPLTSKDRGIPTHVPLRPPEGGLAVPSVLLCDAVRSISRERLTKKLGAVSPDTVAEVDMRLRLLMGL